MMNIFSTMITGICCCAIFASMSNSMLKPSGVTEILKLSTGIVMILMFFYPLVNMQNINFDMSDAFIPTGQQISEDYDNIADELIARDIEKSLAFFVEEQGFLYGIDLHATVTVKEAEELYIEQVIIRYKTAEQSNLQGFISEICRDFGIQNEDILLIEE